ncbi:hypothetical protein [Pseudomonas serbica]|uniref:hypothetical protein n=1 Tax=Pseudomonas serbica TaxID=2965074 RepID=UPI00237C0BED|nr:hypothetical protein [Pseudomonas serbica]
MSRRIEALFVVLQEACKEQFGFAPERIKENLQYLGTVGDSSLLDAITGELNANAVHRFSDRVWGAEIQLSLNPVNATLFERPPMMPWPEKLLAKFGDAEINRFNEILSAQAKKIGQIWPEKMLTEYRKTDLEIKAERDARDANVKYTLESPLWASVGPFVRSQFPGHETSVAGAMSAISLYRLVEELAEKGDPDFVTFAEHIGAKTTEELSWHLEMTYRCEHEMAVWEKIKSHPSVKAIDILLPELNSGSRHAKSKVEELAYEVCDSLPQYEEVAVDSHLIILLVTRNQVAKQPVQIPEDDSPAP